MFDLFKFRLPIAVTEQLIAKLEGLTATALTLEALRSLADFQVKHDMRSGVYVLYLDGKAVYAGKADDVVDRLQQHLEKIRGRVILAQQEIGYKALVLDENWSTSANEGLLISHYKTKGECEWNGAGFGPKDVGKRRDGQEPNWFDKQYPINTDWKIDSLEDKTTLREVLAAMKNQLPYLLRYELDVEDLNRKLNLKGVERTAHALASLVAKTLGREYQFVVFHSHMVVYKSKKQYEYGTVLPER